MNTQGPLLYSYNLFNVLAGMSKIDKKQQYEHNLFLMYNSMLW